MRLFLKNLLFTVVVPGTVAVYIPVFLFSHEPLALSIRTLAATAILAFGGAVYLWCLWDFATTGRGTPAPIDPPRHLVVRGLYRFTRNPMYVGVVSTILGWALLFGSTPVAVYGFCAALFFHLFVVLYEEPHLRRVFGADYEQYCRRVGRWLSFDRPK